MSSIRGFVGVFGRSWLGYDTLVAEAAAPFHGQKQPRSLGLADFVFLACQCPAYEQAPLTKSLRRMFWQESRESFFVHPIFFLSFWI